MLWQLWHSIEINSGRSDNFLNSHTLSQLVSDFFISKNLKIIRYFTRFYLHCDNYYIFLDILHTYNDNENQYYTRVAGLQIDFKSAILNKVMQMLEQSTLFKAVSFVHFTWLNFPLGRMCLCHKSALNRLLLKSMSHGQKRKKSHWQRHTWTL